MAYAYSPKRNLAWLVERTQRLLRDFRAPGANGYRYAWSEIADAVNECVVEMVRSTGVLREVAVIPILDDIQVYDLPPDCMRPLRLAFNGRNGTVLLPTSLTYLDLTGQANSAGGNPEYFFVEFLAQDQIAFLPTPSDGGSTFTRGSTAGLLRGITDADGYVPFDGGYALRDLRGVPFSVTGRDRIIREAVSPYGNVLIHYVRYPERMIRADEYPDSDVPYYIHKDIPYGSAELMLRYARTKAEGIRRQRFGQKWTQRKGKLQQLLESRGPMAGVRPI